MALHQKRQIIVRSIRHCPLRFNMREFIHHAAIVGPE
jgi:hypothetical protein